MSSILSQTNTDTLLNIEVMPSFRRAHSTPQAIALKALEESPSPISSRSDLSSPPSSISSPSSESDISDDFDTTAQINARNLQAVTQLLDPKVACDVRALRKYIPRKKDPTLQKIMGERAIVRASKKDPDALAKTLHKKKYQSKHVSVGGEEFTVYTDSLSRRRLIMDLNTPKVNNFLLTRMPEGGPDVQDDPHLWSNCITNVKTCTSILSPREASFCGKDGAIVYLTPTKQHAIINAAPHDMLSPSETHMGDKMYDSARKAVQGYVQDQEKLRIIFDLISSLKLEAVDHLRKTLAHDKGKLARTIEMLERDHSPTFEKRFYTLETQQSELEINIDYLIRALIRYPELQRKIGVDVEQLRVLDARLKTYLDHPEIVERATQRRAVTGWEISEHDKDHVLHPTQRSSGKRLEKLAQPLKAKGLLTSTLDGEEELTDVSKFMTQNKEHLFKNILRNSVVNYSLSDAEKLLDQYKEAPHVKKVEQELSLLPFKMPNSFASVASGKAVGISKREAISDLHRTLAESYRLKQEIASVKHSVKNTYSEIQVHSDQMQVVGFGLKKELLDKVLAPDFIKNFKQLTAELQQTQSELAKESTLKLKKKEASLQKQLDEMAPSIATYRLMCKAKRLNIPCFIHYGLTEEYPRLS